jgi:hypothetical protein
MATPARPHRPTPWAENTTTTNLPLVLSQKMKGGQNLIFSQFLPGHEKNPDFVEKNLVFFKYVLCSK